MGGCESIGWLLELGRFRVLLWCCVVARVYYVVSKVLLRCSVWFEALLGGN